MLESKCSTAEKIEDCSCNRPYCCWKQVEINTIASGFGHLGPISREIQRCILILFHTHTNQIKIECLLWYQIPNSSQRK